MFSHLARVVEHAAGSPWAFASAAIVILVWAATGPLFGWSDTWQLVINTGTTVITFLMVFILQATQTRDTAAIQLKLDELIFATGTARNAVIAAEDMEAKQLDAMRQDIQRSATGGYSQ